MGIHTNKSVYTIFKKIDQRIGHKNYLFVFNRIQLKLINEKKICKLKSVSKSYVYIFNSEDLA